MKNIIGLALSLALMLVVAGCSSTAQNTNAAGAATDSAAENTTPNLDFAAKCPGVHYAKLQAWTDDQVMQQEHIKQGDIPACEQWIASQPPGMSRPDLRGCQLEPRRTPPMKVVAMRGLGLASVRRLLK